MSVAEVADQNRVAERAEIGGRLNNSPGRVQHAVRREARQQVSVRVERVDDAQPRSDNLFALVVALRVGDEQPRADRVNRERRVAGRKIRIGERAARSDSGEGRIEHVDAAVAEICGVEHAAGGIAGDRDAEIRCAAGGVVDHDDGLGGGRRRRDARRPGGDDAVGPCEDEAGRAGACAVDDHEIVAAVEDDAGRRAGAVDSGRRRDVDDERLRRAVAVVERGCAAALVGDPPDAGGIRHDAPGVDEVGVRVLRTDEAVGHEVFLLVEGVARQRGGRAERHERANERAAGAVRSNVSVFHRG